VGKSGLIAGGGLVAVAAVGLLIGWTVVHRRKPVTVTLVAAVPKAFEGAEVTLTGALQPQSTEQIDAPVAGVLEAWFVDIGGEVYESQLVGRIRNADLDNALQTAQAAIDRAEMRVAQLDGQAVGAKLETSRTDADKIRAHNELDRIEKIYQRYKLLMAADAIARLTFEKTEAEYKSAQAEVANRDAASKDAEEKAAAIDHDSEEAKRALPVLNAALEQAKEAVAKGDLHSPADGVVLTRNVHQGDKVEESSKNLMTIATKLTKLAVSLAPEPPVLARIRIGQRAFVHFADAEFPGEVHDVHGTEVVVWFASPEPIMKLGTAAQVRIVF
jgi:multidrug resistance efflux pump